MLQKAQISIITNCVVCATFALLQICAKADCGELFARRNFSHDIDLFHVAVFYKKCICVSPRPLYSALRTIEDCMIGANLPDPLCEVIQVTCTQTHFFIFLVVRT